MHLGLQRLQSDDGCFAAMSLSSRDDRAMIRNPFICLKSGCDACIGTLLPCEFVCLECMRHMSDEWRPIDDHCDGCTAVTEMPKCDCKFALEMLVAQ